MPETIIARDIVVETFFDGPGSFHKLRMGDYFGNVNYIFESTSEAPEFKAVDLAIEDSDKSVKYGFDMDSGYWNLALKPKDTYEYTIKNVTTEVTSSAKVTIHRIEEPDTFDLEVVEILTEMPALIQVNLDENLGVGIELLSFECLNPYLFKSLKQAPENKAGIMFETVAEEWDLDNDVYALINYTAKEISSGDIKQGRLKIQNFTV